MTDMWVLRHLQKPNVVYGLIDGDQYTFGRSNFGWEDTSISRSHARISVRKNEVFVQDVGSKYGTYVGEKAFVTSQNNSQEDRLNEGEEQKMFASQCVRFGLLSTAFKLERLELNICTSSLSSDDLVNAKKYITGLGLGAVLFNKWSNEVTHLVVRYDNYDNYIRQSNCLIFFIF